MKEQYIKRVKRLLKVPRQKKREILRDLEEAFASAAEHGETEQQVLERLGTPEAFAAAMTESGDMAAFQRQRTLTGLWVSLAVSAAAFGGWAAVTTAWKTSLGIIGGADGPTVIFVTGDGALWSVLSNLTIGPSGAPLLILVGAIALLTAVVQLIRLIRHRKPRK